MFRSSNYLGTTWIYNVYYTYTTGLSFVENLIFISLVEDCILQLEQSKMTFEIREKDWLIVGKDIAERTYSHWKSGGRRWELTVFDMEQVLNAAAFNEKGW